MRWIRAASLKFKDLCQAFNIAPFRWNLPSNVAPSLQSEMRIEGSDRSGLTVTARLHQITTWSCMVRIICYPAPCSGSMQETHLMLCELMIANGCRSQIVADFLSCLFVLW